MKTRKAIILIAALVALVCVLTGCFVKSKVVTGSGTSYKYDSASKYNVGSASVDASRINELEIDWVSGKIQIVYGRGRAIEFSETLKSGKLSEDEQLRWMVDGSKLKIMFVKSGISLVSNFSKDLVVTIPEGMAFKSIDLDCVSTDCEINAVADIYDIDTVSGSVKITSDYVRDVDMDSVSGNAELSFGVCPQKVEMDTVSGNCKIIIPKDSGFKAKLSSVSGDISCTIPAMLSKDRIEAGDGSASFSFNSVSGDVSIEGK